jgi:DNA-binding transcriptional ArsR family regulator
MKRDMDLVREILLAVEAVDDHSLHELPVIDGYDQQLVGSHIEIMQEAGLIDAMDCRDLSGGYWIPKKLTWEGHEFLDQIRPTERWSKTKAVIGKLGDFSIATTKQVASEIAKKALRDGVNELI